jgi:DNA-binding response OmpR family regulator
MEHAPRADRTALIVDDDVFIVAALAEILEEDGFDVHTASNGFSAQRQAAEIRPSVVLLDLALPERSGADLLHDFRADAATQHMAIVIVTGHVDELSESQLAEADDVITKPFDESDLLLRVHRAVQRAASRRSEVAPIAATAHPNVATRPRRAANPRRTRGRR